MSIHKNNIVAKICCSKGKNDIFIMKVDPAKAQLEYCAKYAS